MPKTVILKKTWRCPCCPHPGLSQWDNDCFEGQPCPNCGEDIVALTTDTDRMGTMTIIGEEDIEIEIAERDETTHRTKRQAETEEQLEGRDARGEFATTTAKDIARQNSHADIERNILSLDLAGYFLKTPEQVSVYRAKRVADISAAITEARKHEFKG